MHLPRLLPLLATALLGWCATLHADEDVTASVTLSKPGEPATVHIFVAQGTINVKANDSKDTVSVSPDAQVEKPSEVRPDGLRVISSGAATFSLTEKDNVVEIDYGREGGPATAGADFFVSVPRSANIVVTNSWGSDVEVQGVEGDVEVKTMQGEVRLTDLTGGVLVETMNGEVFASFRSIPAAKPLSFATMNGKIEVHLPEDARANVRFRTQNGSVMTDFEEDVLKTRTEAKPETRGRQEAARAAGEAARDAAREAARVAREMAEDFREAFQEGQAPTAPRPPRAPRPPSIPSMVGGKVVSGSLNGGGTDLQAATMNGDIVIRRTSAK